MSEKLKDFFEAPNGDDFRRYLRGDSTLPPLDISRLDMAILVGEERTSLRTHTGGDASLVIRYKGKEGAVTSFDLQEDSISVMQIQGSNQEGYRLTTGMVWVHHFADKLVEIAHHPDAGFRKLIMVGFHLIKGAEDTRELAVGRYADFAIRAGLKFNEEERLWVRDIKRE